MQVADAKAFAKYRLFRPLGFESLSHKVFRSDRALAKAIAKWTSNILLGGHHYDLDATPEGVFQIQSSRMNRLSYLVPVWNPKLAREIVLRTEKKSPKARLGCGLGPLEELDYLGGILFLNRVVFRGTKFYQRTHKSESRWFVEDRYHFDVFAVPRSPRKTEGWECGDTDPAAYPTKTQIDPLLRVFHDSIGCVALPRWSPGTDVDTHNRSIEKYTPEYFPEASELIMTWHELAGHVGVQYSGIYALANFIASELARGMNYAAVGSSFFWAENNPSQSLIDLSLADDALWTTPGQPLSNQLVNSYAGFLRNAPGGAKQAYNVDSYTDTRLFQGNLGAALVQFLLSRANGTAEYLGNGFFRLQRTNATQLAAGTGNWGSAEGEGIGISQKVGPEHAETGASNDSQVKGGIARLVVDYFRYKQSDAINQAIATCRTKTSAECKECVDNSVADTYQDLGVSSDIVDVIGGIAACALTDYYGGPAAALAVCGVTIPAAGNAAKDFWNNALSGYDYADDMCSGLPDASPTYASPGDTTGAGGGPQPTDPHDETKKQLQKQCEAGGGVFQVENIYGEDACSGDPKTICERLTTLKNVRLLDAWCVPGASAKENDHVVCLWCTALTS